MKKYYTILILLCFCLSSLVPKILSAQIVTLNLKPGPAAGKDAYLSSSASSVNYGNHPELSGDAWTCSGSPCFARGLMQFDLSSIPSFSQIQSAKLSLRANPSPGNGGGIAMQGNNSAKISRVVSPWNESSATWNNQPTFSTSNQVSLMQSTSSFQNYLNIDVANLVQDMINDPSNSYGFFLELDNEVAYATMIFASSDFPDSSYWPEIEIQYSPVVCETYTNSDNSNNGDAYLSSTAPNVNYENHPEFSGDAWTCSGSPCFGRGLINFDFIGLPANSQLVSAQLNLHSNPSPVNGGGVAMQGNNAAWIQRVTSLWSPSTVTWNTAPSTTTTNQVSLAQSTSGSQDYLNIDVTGIVQDMILNPGNSYGFMLRLQNETAYATMIFSSSDAVDLSLRPSLQICYASTSSVNEVDNTFGEVSAYPNPFSSEIDLNVNLKKSGSLMISLVDVVGRIIYVENSKILNAGSNHIKLNGDFTNISKGIYFLKYKLTNIQL